MSAGKGDTRRPSSVPAAEFAARWRRTFARVVDAVAPAPQWETVVEKIPSPLGEITLMHSHRKPIP